MTERLYFRQLLSGADFATADPLARQMVNFTYLVGDRDTGECMIVDPAYSVDELLAQAEADEMRLTGVLVSHYHPDHVGGSMMGFSIMGVRELLERHDVPVHVQRVEAPWVQKATGLSADQLALHDPGDQILVGTLPIDLLHTPGHTPGSQCFLVEGRLITGDTLFLEGCGRTDLPGSDPAAMYDSLQRLSTLPPGLLVCPGHRYSFPATATLGDVRDANYVFGPRTKDQWLTMFGR